MNRVLEPGFIQNDPQTPLSTACRVALQANNAALPSQWQDLRQDAYIQFERKGMPTNKNEAWKYVNLRSLMDTPWQTLDADLLAPHGNNCGVWMLTLAEAWADPAMAERLALTIRKQLPQLTDPFALLSLALGTRGWVIHAPAKACHEGVLDLTLHLPLARPVAATPDKAETLGKADAHLLGQQTAYMHHALVIVLVDEGAEINVRLSTTSQPDVTPRLLNIGVLVDVAAGGVLHGLNQQRHQQHTTPDAPVIQLDTVIMQQAPDSTVHWTTLDNNGGQTRHYVHSHLNGANAAVTANALGILHHTSVVHHHTVVEHHTPHTTSSQLVKGIVDDNALMDFGGTIVVDPHAQKTNASQQNRHLMLSESAKVFARPQLRIDADDVKCSHGASIGQIDEEALFYLVSRGLSAHQARQILTDGFGAEVLNQLPKGLCFVARPHVALH
jgi:Fe-S cluster assembly protein SufD